MERLEGREGLAERELLALKLAEQELAEQELAGPARPEADPERPEADPGQPEADPGQPGAGVAEQSLTVPGLAEQSLAVPGLASGLAAAIERLIGLFRSLSPANGLSLTAAATLATLERSGPCRLTWLAVREGVTQPAMTQLIGRLQDAGLVDRVADPADGRVVQVRLTADGQATLAGRRAVRADRLAGLLARLSPDEQHVLAAALPAMEALAIAQRADQAAATPARAGQNQAGRDRAGQ
jgi:DNA-binding MarR family transcriptional regulator